LYLEDKPRRGDIKIRFALPNTYSEEYLKMLSDFEVEYDAKYLFEFYD